MYIATMENRLPITVKRKALEFVQYRLFMKIEKGEFGLEEEEGFIALREEPFLM